MPSEGLGAVNKIAVCQVLVDLQIVLSTGRDLSSIPDTLPNWEKLRAHKRKTKWVQNSDF